MMDAETQDKFERLEFYLEDADDNYLNNEDARWLLRIAQEQKSQLAKYERVVEAAKQLMLFNESLPWKQASDPSRIKSLYKCLNDLKNAVDELEAK